MVTVILLVGAGHYGKQLSVPSPCLRLFGTVGRPNWIAHWGPSDDSEYVE